jgi:hypothetical protein
VRASFPTEIRYRVLLHRYNLFTDSTQSFLYILEYLYSHRRVRRSFDSHEVEEAPESAKTAQNSELHVSESAAQVITRPSQVLKDKKVNLNNLPFPVYFCFNCRLCYFVGEDRCIYEVDFFVFVNLNFGILLELVAITQSALAPETLDVYIHWNTKN